MGPLSIVRSWLLCLATVLLLYAAGLHHARRSVFQSRFKTCTFVRCDYDAAMAGFFALPRHQAIVPIASAIGSTNMAFCKEDESEIFPMSGGDARSPKR